MPRRRSDSDATRARRLALRGGAMAASVGVHALVATTLLVAPRPIERLTSGAAELDLVEVQVEPPELPEPPPPEPSPPELTPPGPTIREPLVSHERGLRVRAPDFRPRLTLGRTETRGPFDYRERLDVGRYAPRIPVPSTSVRSVPAVAPSPVETAPGEATPVEATVTAPTLSPEPAHAVGEPTEVVIAPPLEAIPIRIVATGRVDLAALRAIGNGTEVSRCLEGFGFDPLSLLGLEASEVLASADVRGTEPSAGRAIALSTRLEASALRQRLEGAAIARGAAPVFGDSPLPSSTTLVVQGQSYTLTLDGPRLVLASLASVDLLRDGFEGLAGGTNDAISVAERLAPRVNEGPRPSRLRASVRGPTTSDGPAQVRLEFEFDSEPDAELARALGLVWIDVARRALGLPESAVASASEPTVVGSTLVLDTTPERMSAADLAVRFGRAD